MHWQWISLDRGESGAALKQLALLALAVSAGQSNSEETLYGQSLSDFGVGVQVRFFDEEDFNRGVAMVC